MIEITENGFIHLNQSAVGNNVILSILGEPIKLDKNFTLRSFFKMFFHYPKLAELEAYLEPYLELYHSNLSNLEPVKNNNKLILNSYLVNEPKKKIDIRHNLIIQFRSRQNFTIDKFQIEEFLDSEFSLTRTVWSYKVEQENGVKRMVRLNETYPVEVSCNLHEFILWTCGSLFKGKSPIRRKHHVEEINKNISIASNSVMKDITELLKA